MCSQIHERKTRFHIPRCISESKAASAVNATSEYTLCLAIPLCLLGDKKRNEKNQIQKSALQLKHTPLHVFTPSIIPLQTKYFIMNLFCPFLLRPAMHSVHCTPRVRHTPLNSWSASARSAYHPTSTLAGDESNTPHYNVM